MAEDRRAKELRNLSWVLEHVLMHPLEGNMRDLKEILLNGLLDIGTLKKDDGVSVPPVPKDETANDDAVEITVRGLLHKHGNQSAVERELGWTRSRLRAFMKRRGIDAK
jgi:DNA-binding NtrC family response regulator